MSKCINQSRFERYAELNSTEQNRQRQGNVVCCSVKLYCFGQGLRHEVSVVEKDQSVRNKSVC